jgi:hypothetical protein
VHNRHPSCSERKVSDEEEEDKYCSLTCHVGPLNANKAEEKNLSYTLSLGTIISIKELRRKVESDVTNKIDMIFTCKRPYFFPMLRDYNVALFSLDRIQAVSENSAIITKNGEEEIMINPQIEHFRIITIQNYIMHNVPSEIINLRGVAYDILWQKFAAALQSNQGDQLSYDTESIILTFKKVYVRHENWNKWGLTQADVKALIAHFDEQTITFQEIEYNKGALIALYWNSQNSCAIIIT